MSDTSTKKNKTATSRRNKTPHNVGRRAGGLTLRILSVNMLPLIVLVVGLLSLGRYQQNLTDEHLKTLQERAQNFAVAIEGPDNKRALIPDQSRRTLFKLAENRQGLRIRLFDPQGQVIGDSQKLSGPGGVIRVTQLPAPEGSFTISAGLAYLGTKMLELLPSATTLKTFPEDIEFEDGTNGMVYPDVVNAMQGNVSSTAWKRKNGGLVLAAAAPIYKNDRLSAIILLTNDGRDVELAMDRVRFDVLTATLAALSMTIFMSIYLAGLIGHPLRKLARAAERIRVSKGQDVTIPDMSRRRDEIGELSMALRDMTKALRDRMDSIESFAADVAHELKNPLTSLRSAVETVTVVKNAKDREKLLDIILHDVQRLDRLISDISKASRLDAELSRDEMKEIDLRNLIENIVSGHMSPMERTGVQEDTCPIKLEIPRNKEIKTLGNEGRLAQVFENLLGNALSFSPENGIVTVRIMPSKDRIIIEIEDEGPGIPENKLDEIFERFYSERPKTEAYGKHSGLGLSICKQIITAHGGEIYAENIKTDGTVKGACFTVILTVIS